MRIGAVCESVSQTFRRQLDEVVLINTSDVLDGTVTNHVYVPNENLRGQFKKSFRQNDILYSEIRPKNRRFAFVNFDASDYVASTKLMVIRSNELVLPEFLFQVLKSDMVIDQLQLLAETRSGTFPQITFSELAALDVRIPSIDEQREIAGTLRALDDKITNNTTINHHLYELLQSYFCWFRNESNENVYGTISQICSYSNSRISVETLTLNSYYSTENMLPNKAGSVAASSLPSMSLTTKCTAGDTLVSNIRPYFKKIFFCEKECGCSTDVLCFKPIDEWLAPYLFCVFYDDKFFDYMMAGSKGTKMPRGDKQQIMNYRIVIPPLKDRKDFAEFAMPILEQIKKNEHEIQMLSSLRDTLLPKLMSGEIDVSKINI